MSNAIIESQLKELIVEALQLESVNPADIASDGQLFGGGLKLDSIDALELASAVETKFGVKFVRTANMEAIFGSVHALANYIVEQQALRANAGPQNAGGTP